MDKALKFLRKYRAEIVWAALTLVAGIIGALLSGGFDTYERYVKPPLAPPGWLFPIVWTFLYILMGVAAGMIAATRDLDKGIALKLYVLQLIINIVWPIIFFRFEAPKFALFWLALLLIAVFITLKNFRSINKTAGRLLIVYIIWCCFAFYLNFGIVVLNS